MNKFKSKLGLDRILVLILLIVISIVSIVSILVQERRPDVKTAQVARLLDLVQDGGFFYQNVEGRILENNEFISLKIQIKDLNLENVKVGDIVYVKPLESGPGFVYSYLGHSRGNILFWVLVIFFAFVLVILGKEGITYIASSILVFVLLFSGALYYILTASNIYVGVLGLLGVISFTTILLQLRNLKIAAIVTVSQLITLFIILLINVILFKASFLTELFYGNLSFLESSISLVDFWSIINAAVMIVAFGASINTTLDVAASIIRKKKTYPSTTTINLVREGTSHNQIANARVINSLFFVFLGVTLANIMIATHEAKLPFWEDAAVVQGLLIFINASVSALLVGPITAVITAITVNAKEDSRFQLKLAKGKKI